MFGVRRRRLRPDCLQLPRRRDFPLGDDGRTVRRGGRLDAPGRGRRPRRQTRLGGGRGPVEGGSAGVVARWPASPPRCRPAAVLDHGRQEHVPRCARHRRALVSSSMRRSRSSAISDRRSSCSATAAVQRRSSRRRWPGRIPAFWPGSNPYCPVSASGNPTGVSLEQVCSSTFAALRHSRPQSPVKSGVSASRWPLAARVKLFLGHTTTLPATTCDAPAC